MIQGTPDTLDGVSAVAKKIGINQNMINGIFDKYGNTMQARALCSMLGTTPEALKKDADTILNGTNKSNTHNAQAPTRFPRLK